MVQRRTAVVSTSSAVVGSIIGAAVVWDPCPPPIMNGDKLIPFGPPENRLYTLENNGQVWFILPEEETDDAPVDVLP